MRADLIYRDIYETGVIEGDWRPALERLRVVLGSAEVAFVRAGAEITADTTNRVLSPESYDHYRRYYGRLDPKAALFTRHGAGFLFNDAEHFDDRFVAKDSFYQEFSAPLGTRHTLDHMVGRCGTEDVYLAAMRSAALGPYDNAAAGRLRRAGEHFLRALKLRSTLELAQRASAALDGLSYGIVILDETLRIVFANGFARDTLSDCTELAIRHARLNARSAAAEQFLAGASSQALHRGAPAAMTRLTRRDGRKLYLWRVGLPASSPLAQAERPGVLLVLRDPRRQPMVDASVLLTLFGLTDAEARLALAIGAGARLEAVAAERGVKLSTVRTQLLSVLAKMGVHRQADLARAMAALSSPVAAGPDC
jgi:DNA-binding CsgD family transcriptional regulator